MFVIVIYQSTNDKRYAIISGIVSTPSQDKRVRDLKSDYIYTTNFNWPLETLVCVYFYSYLKSPYNITFMSIIKYKLY